MPSCQKCHSKFEIRTEEEEFCKKNNIPLPDICPECRLIRRLQERNARKLYYRNCDFSGKKILSIYHENQPFPVYDQEIWWSDKWDPMEYGQDFDFERPFFEQLKELKNKVPHFSVFIVGGTLENSEYTNCTGYLKNCYLISESDYDEDCAYSNRIYHSKNLIDCTNCYDCELCYECMDCSNSYELKYSSECENCSSGFFLKNCIGCKDCVACTNQRHKQFMIFNKKYSEEDYNKKLNEFNLSNYDSLNLFEKKVKEFFISQPRKAIEGEHNENVVGDHVFDSKNAYMCFDCKDLEDCTYCTKVASNVKNCIDYTAWGFKAELIYNSAACGDNAYNLKFCSNCTTNNSNQEYCFMCTGSSNLFGCVGLKKKEFCILNKQYSEKDFYEFRDRIVSHMSEWGKFAPIDICPFGYNETIAMDHFPLTKKEALEKGYKWSDYEIPIPEVKKTITTDKLPKNISEIPDEILDWAIICEITKKPFKINKQELDFYRKLNIPCPRRRPDQRHSDRMAKRPLYKLEEANCDMCGKKITKNISNFNSTKVLCSECYSKNVYCVTI